MGLAVPYLPDVKQVHVASANETPPLPSAFPGTAAEQSAKAKASGVNCADHDEIAVEVALKGGASAATVDVFYWSDEADRFLPPSPAQSLSVSGQGQRFIVRVGHARSVYLAATSITGGSGERVFINAGGVPVYGNRGN